MTAERQRTALRIISNRLRAANRECRVDYGRGQVVVDGFRFSVQVPDGVRVKPYAEACAHEAHWRISAGMVGNRSP